jgi:hypothetical protein
LAFLRLGQRPFSADDRQLIDEFAGRLGLALARCPEKQDGGVAGDGPRPAAGPVRW